MKKVSFSAVLLLFILWGIAQPADSTYYFSNGVPFYVCQQPDMLSFRLNNKLQYVGTFDTSVVDKIEYYGTGDGIHNVYFSAGATETEKLATLSAIESSPNFEKFFAVGTKTSNFDKPYSDRMWMATDMQMNIIFKDPQITLAEAEAFAAEYQCHVVFDPQFEGGVYVFEVNQNHQLFDYSSPTLTIQIVRQMWIDHEDKIFRVAPSIRVFQPHTEDPYYIYQWWMDDPLTTSCNAGYAPPGTGIDLPCAWNYDYAYGDGPMYSGQNVVVGVIDFHGVQWEHPDLDGSFMDGWVAFGDVDGEAGVVKIYEEGSPVYHMAWNEAHLQNVSGVISADIDNETGSTGVAYNAMITPCLQQGTTAQLAALLQRLLIQHTLSENEDDQVDIINMSFGFGGMTVEDAMGFPFYTAMENCAINGRDGKGIVLVASAGNENEERENIPAALPFVFSVAGTNPLDQLKTAGDGFDPFDGNWGSTYFDGVDVAAPSICITSTDFSDDVPGFPELEGTGYGIGDYYSFSGTSASAPIVSGIAALILEKDPTLTNSEIYSAIRMSAEKVGGYSYTTLAPNGKCLELGYGRVNACGALNILDQLSIVEEGSNVTVLHTNPVTDILNVVIEEDLKSYTVRLLNVAGQIVYESNFKEVSTFQIDMTSFSKGIYYLNIVDIRNQNLFTSKIIK